jgi:DNA-binding response OmpR family regulator
LEELLVIMVVEDDQAIQTMVEVALADGGFEPATPRRVKKR